METCSCSSVIKRTEVKQRSWHCQQLVAFREAPGRQRIILLGQNSTRRNCKKHELHSSTPTDPGKWAAILSASYSVGLGFKSRTRQQRLSSVVHTKTAIFSKITSLPLPSTLHTVDCSVIILPREETESGLIVMFLKKSDGISSTEL
jgi:hypothetical protein